MTGRRPAHRPKAARRPPLDGHGSAGTAVAIEIVLAEFRELEAEKRQFAQALLAVTGIVVGADAVLVAQATAEHPLPLVGLAPLTLAAFALVLNLRRYISKFIGHLANMEDQLNELGGGQLLGWERSWYDVGPESRLFGRGGFVVAVAFGIGLATIGLWVGLSSSLVTGVSATPTSSSAVAPALPAWPDWLKGVAATAYIALCALPVYVALKAIEGHEREVHRWKAYRRLRRVTKLRVSDTGHGPGADRRGIAAERNVRGRRVTMSAAIEIASRMRDGPDPRAD